MERYNLGDEMFRLVNMYLAENSLKVNCGKIVDATIINVPTSTKNKDKARDPDMYLASQRQSMVLWDEGAYWRGSSDQIDSFGCCHGRQCA